MTRGDCAEVSDEKTNQVELTEISEANGNGFTIHENGNGSNQTTNSRPARPSDPAPLPPEVTLTPIIHRPSDLVVNHSRFRFPVSSSSSTGRCGRLRSRWIVGTSAILLSLLTVGVFLGIMLHFTVRDHRDRHAQPVTPSTPRVPRAETALGDAVPTFLCSVTLSHQYWEPELADVRSERYKQLAIDTEQELDRIFLVSPLKDIYNFSVVRTFRRGSIVVVFETVLTRPSHLNPDQLKRAFLDGLEFRERMLLSDAQEIGMENSEQKTFLQLNKQNIVLVVPSTTTLHSTSQKTDFQTWQRSTEHDQTRATGIPEHWHEDIKLHTTTRVPLPITSHDHPKTTTTIKPKLSNNINQYDATPTNAKDVRLGITVIDDKYTRKDKLKSKVIETVKEQSDAERILTDVESSHHHHEDSEDVSAVLSSPSVIQEISRSIHQSLDIVHIQTQSQIVTASSLYSDIGSSEKYMESGMSSLLQSQIMTSETPALLQSDVITSKLYPNLQSASSLIHENVTTTTNPKETPITSSKNKDVASKIPPKMASNTLLNNAITTESYPKLTTTTSLHNNILTVRTSLNNSTLENIELEDIFNKENVEDTSSVYEHTIGVKISSSPVSVLSETRNHFEARQPEFTDSIYQSSKGVEFYNKWLTKSNASHTRNVTEKYSNMNEILLKRRHDFSSLNDDNMIPIDKPRYLDKMKSKKKFNNINIDGDLLKNAGNTETLEEPKMLNRNMSQKLSYGSVRSTDSQAKADDSSDIRIDHTKISHVLQASNRDYVGPFKLEPSISITEETSSPKVSSATPTLLHGVSDTSIITGPNSSTEANLVSSTTVPLMISPQGSNSKEYSKVIKSLPYLDVNDSSYFSTNSVGLSQYYSQTFSMNTTSSIHNYSKMTPGAEYIMTMMLSSSILAKDISNSIYKQHKYASASITNPYSTESFVKLSQHVSESVVSPQPVASSLQTQVKQPTQNSEVLTFDSESYLTLSVFPTNSLQHYGHSNVDDGNSRLVVDPALTSRFQDSGYSEVNDRESHLVIEVSPRITLHDSDTIKLSVSESNLSTSIVPTRATENSRTTTLDVSVSHLVIELSPSIILHDSDTFSLSTPESNLVTPIVPTSVTANSRATIFDGSVSHLVSKVSPSIILHNSETFKLGTSQSDLVTPIVPTSVTENSRTTIDGSVLHLGASVSPTSVLLESRISKIDEDGDVFLERRSTLLIHPTATLVSEPASSSSRPTHEPVSKIPDTWSSSTATDEIYNPCLDINIMTEFIPQCLDYFSQIPDTTDTVEKCQHFLAGVICVTDYYFNYSGQQCSESEIRAFIRQHAALFGNALPGFNPLKCIM